MEEEIKETKDGKACEIADQARKETYDLMERLSKVVNEFQQEESIIEHNERFLVISRAVNGFGVGWCKHFWRQFNPEEKMKETPQ